MPSVTGSDFPSGIVTPGGFGVWGDSQAHNGVIGYSRDASGVFGWALSASPGVHGINGVNGAGTFGGSIDGPGVFGHSVNSTGVLGYSVNGYAGDFVGRVRVSGWLTKPGGSFLIDHPLDPANKYLAHSFVESPEMKNIYDGVAVLDAQGEATVHLPDWFDALNQEFRYQLTCIGVHAPVFIAREIEGTTFSIAGGPPGLKVSWQVTGNRKDAWAVANPLVVEREKPEEERGLFLYPEVLGEPAEKSILLASVTGSSVVLPQPGSPDL